MRKLAGLLCGVMLMVVVGCSSAKPYEHITGPVYVRDVQHSYYVLESDNGAIWSVAFMDNPPIWKGMHCELTYHYEDGTSGEGYLVDSVKHLPGDIH